MITAKELYTKTNSVEMVVKTETPPNFEQIKEVLPDSTKEGVLFCYGTAIYNPSQVMIPPWLYSHEKVHASRQTNKSSDGGIMLPENISTEQWWDKYLTDQSFRFNEELLAHAVEYYVFKQYFKGDEKRKNYLRTISRRLSSPLYSAGVNQRDCRRMILDMMI